MAEPPVYEVPGPPTPPDPIVFAQDHDEHVDTAIAIDNGASSLQCPLDTSLDRFSLPSQALRIFAMAGPPLLIHIA